MALAHDLPPGTDIGERRSLGDLLGSQGQQRVDYVCGRGPRPAGTQDHPVQSIIADANEVGQRRSDLENLLPARVWLRIAAMGRPDPCAEPYGQRLNCVLVAALIRTALIDHPNLDQARLEQHWLKERLLAEAFRELGDHYRRKGIYR